MFAGRNGETHCSPPRPLGLYACMQESTQLSSSRVLNHVHVDSRQDSEYNCTDLSLDKFCPDSGDPGMGGVFLRWDADVNSLTSSMDEPRVVPHSLVALWRTKLFVRLKRSEATFKSHLVKQTDSSYSVCLGSSVVIGTPSPRGIDVAEQPERSDSILSALLRAFPHTYSPVCIKRHSCRDLRRLRNDALSWHTEAVNLFGTF